MDIEKSISDIESMIVPSCKESFEPVFAELRRIISEREQLLAQKPFSYCYTDVNGRAKELCESPDCQIPQDKRVITPLYAQAVPAQQVYETQEDFNAGQWWVSELNDAIKNGTPDQRRAYAVVLNLLRQIRHQPSPAVAVPENKFGENLVWFLKEFASADDDQLEYAELEIYGETEEGVEGCCTVTVNEICEAAANAIELLVSAASPRITEQDAPITLTEDQVAVLGRPNFACSSIARVLVHKGIYAEIPPRSENEQAVAIHFLADMLASHGENWKTEAEKILSGKPESERNCSDDWNAQCNCGHRWRAIVPNENCPDCNKPESVGGLM